MSKSIIGYKHASAVLSQGSHAGLQKAKINTDEQVPKLWSCALQPELSADDFLRLQQNP